VKKRRGRRDMRFAWGVSRAVPMSVPLKADAVGPCRLTFGYLSVAGADEQARSPADNALFFETAEGSTTSDMCCPLHRSRGRRTSGLSWN